MTEDAEGLTLPIYFKNAQWAVTGYGIEAVRPEDYYIDAKRLGEERGGLPEWPLHLAEKNWVDTRLFMEAFCIALAVHEGRYERLFQSGNWYENCSRELIRMQEQDRRFNERLAAKYGPDRRSFSADELILATVEELP